MAQYSAILIPRNLGLRSIEIRGQQGYAVDASGLPFFIEELIGQGATHLAVDKGSFYYDSVDALPEVFRKRIRKVDHNQRCLTQLIALMKPIFEEVGARVTATAIDLPNTLEDTVSLAIAELFLRHLRLFLLGIRYQLQIEASLKLMQTGIDLLVHELSSSQSRAHLSMIRHAIGSYEPREVDSLEVRPASPEERLALFREFVEDESYKELSAHSRLLGFPARTERTLILIRRLVERIIKQSPFKQALDFGTRVVEVATRVPLPDSKILQEVIPTHYLPPLVSLKNASISAIGRWIRLQPKFIPTARHRHQSEEDGWSAIGDDSVERLYGGSNAPLLVFHPPYRGGPGIDATRKVYVQVALLASGPDHEGIPRTQFDPY